MGRAAPPVPADGVSWTKALVLHLHAQLQEHADWQNTKVRADFGWRGDGIVAVPWTCSSGGQRRPLPGCYNPVYALQSMPDCVVVTAESIKGVAREVIAALVGNDGDDFIVDEKSEAQRQKLRMAQRGSLTVDSSISQSHVHSVVSLI